MLHQVVTQDTRTAVGISTEQYTGTVPDIG